MPFQKQSPGFGSPLSRFSATEPDYPFAGSRMLRYLLRQEGVQVSRLHIATLMKRMGLEAIYRRPNTSKPAQGTRSIPTCCARWR